MSNLDNGKVLRYSQKYEKIMKNYDYYKIFGLGAAETSLKKIIADLRIIFLTIALKREDYNIRKLFVDTIFRFLATDGWDVNENILHPVLFDKIIWPVFAEEYKKNDAKYIRFIGCCEILIRRKKREIYMAQIGSPRNFCGDSFSFMKYFWEKSFSIDKDQNTLDGLMWCLEIDHSSARMSFYLADEHYNYMKDFKSFEEYVERCKGYCKYSTSKKYDELIRKCELLVSYMHTFDELVKKDGFAAADIWRKTIDSSVV
jgi:hypothetical protein